MKKKVRYNLQEVIDSYTFDIYEFSQTRINNKLTDFFTELREVGELRANSFTLANESDDKVPIQDQFKTKLNNKVILLSPKVDLYMNHYKISII